MCGQTTTVTVMWFHSSVMKCNTFQCYHNTNIDLYPSSENCAPSDD